MNILILTKARLNKVLEQKPTNTEEYLKNDQFFSGWKDGFEKLGHVVQINGDHSFFFKSKFVYKYPNIFRYLNALFRKIGLKKLDRYLFSKKIAMICNKQNIDLIFTEINDSIEPNLIKKFSKRELLITEWFGVFPNMVSKDTLELLKQFDYIWTPCQMDKVYKESNLPVKKFKYLGCAVNQDFMKYEFDKKYEYDIVFVGGIGKHHNNRIAILEKVAKKFNNFAFWGYGEENLPKDSILWKHFKGRIANTELHKVYSSSKIALNLTLDNYDTIEKGMNARLFEIASCNGAMQMCIYDKKIKEFFQIDKDLKTFKDAKELIIIIEDLLLNENQRKKIAKSAYSKSEKYTYSQKAKDVVGILSNE